MDLSHSDKSESRKPDKSKVPCLLQDVLNVIEKERPEGIIVQFGGQTPLSIAKPLQEALLKNPVQAASGETRASPLESPSPLRLVLKTLLLLYRNLKNNRRF